MVISDVWIARLDRWRTFKWDREMVWTLNGLYDSSEMKGVEIL